MPGAFFHISNKQNKSRPQVRIALLFLLIRVCMSFFAKRIHFSPAAAPSQNIQHLDKSNVLGTKDMMCQAPYWAATLTLKLITILWSQCNARPQGVSWTFCQFVFTIWCQPKRKLFFKTPFSLFTSWIMAHTSWLKKRNTFISSHVLCHTAWVSYVWRFFFFFGVGRLVIYGNIVVCHSIITRGLLLDM